MVRINGEPVDVAGQTLEQYLRSVGYDRRHVAVEKNGEIVPRAQYETVELADEDTVEIVCFVGGG